MAEKYFPGLVWWMREDKNNEIWKEALVIFGKMEVVVPKSFVERRGRDDVKGDLLEDDDGLWSD